jgi:exopolysaccharide production protein ExoQ
MPRKTLQSVLEQMLMFCLFFFSNASAFTYLVWLLPEYIYITTFFWAILASLCVWILYKRDLLFVFLGNLKPNWILLPFLTFSALSIFWSVFWQISLARWLVFVFTIIAGGYLSIRYEVKEMVKLLSVFGVFILLISALFVFLPSHIGIMNYYDIQGAWRGLYWHKNHMGIITVFVSSLLLINTLSFLKSREKSAWGWGVLYFLSMIFLLQTDSVGSYMTAIFLHGVTFLALIFLKFRDKIRNYHYIAFFAIIALCFFALYSNLDAIFGVFGRSASLTGRVPMWRHLFTIYFSERMLGGYGFNAFWYIEMHRAVMGIVAKYPDPIVIADNGFIDILINTGFIGLSLFLVFYFGVWWRSIQFMSKAEDVFGIFPLILMSFTLVGNITWSVLFENEGFFMLLMMYVLFFSSYKVPVNKTQIIFKD